MRPRDILAANLNDLIAATEKYRSPKALVTASGVSNGTIGRIRNADVATTLDQLEGLARAFEREAWELLLPPEHRDALRAVSAVLKKSAPTSAAPYTARKKRGAANG